MAMEGVNINTFRTTVNLVVPKVTRVAVTREV
jgi:hypothetical protein